MLTSRQTGLLGRTNASSECTVEGYMVDGLRPPNKYLVLDSPGYRGVPFVACAWEGSLSSSEGDPHHRC